MKNVASMNAYVVLEFTIDCICFFRHKTKGDSELSHNVISSLPCILVLTDFLGLGPRIHPVVLPAPMRIIIPLKVRSAPQGKCAS